jgi:hypothetical protein
VLREPAEQSPGAAPLTALVVVLRAVALLVALAGFADLLFFGDDYTRASRLFHIHYQVATWSLVFLACYPRRTFRFSGIFIVPLMIASLVGAYAWNWLSRNEVLSVAAGEGALQNGAALIAFAFAVEACAAFIRKVSALGDRPARKW